MTIDLRHGDCLDIMPTIPDASVDMVLTDLPYGITRNAWDVRIPMGPLWEQWGRLLRPGGLVVLTASQPFSSELVNSNPSAFRHEWIWVKNRGSNFANTVREPFKEHEHVLVFSPSGKRWTRPKRPSAPIWPGRNNLRQGRENRVETSQNHPLAADAGGPAVRLSLRSG